MFGAHICGELRQLLDGAGVAWRVENRRRHVALIIDGATVLHLSRGGHAHRDFRAWRNEVAAVRRFLRARENGGQQG